MNDALLNDNHRLLQQGQLHDPFIVLGPHLVDEHTLAITVYAPSIETLCIGDSLQMVKRIPDTDFFVWQGAIDDMPQHYRLHAVGKDDALFDYIDPYSFGPQIPEFDLHLFSEGRHFHIYRYLGAHVHEVDGIRGTLFAVWAPNAGRVSVVGEFNDWDGRRYPMRSRGESGVWELFVPQLAVGQRYKFEIFNRHHENLVVRADPYAQAAEYRPGTASITVDGLDYDWTDSQWLKNRANSDWLHAPMSVYELHLGSWKRDVNNEFLNYRELADNLAEYLTALNFTHVELLPITEHPFDGSWGYQVTGYFAPTSRFGTPDDFRYFVDRLHQAGIGVILDWVPAHFPKDEWALSNFDGDTLYEYADPRRGEHRDWGTKIFDYGRKEVQNFLLASAMYWIEEMHIDGIRVDAVASMLYLDYSREEGDWLPNEHGGNENLEAISFIRNLNEMVGSNHPGVVMIAEESTSWPQISRPVYDGGLGFSMKWNMGWMNDTLGYYERDPAHRKYHHSQLTFGMIYQYSENFVLPFSHDEVVHLKKSMLAKMPGDRWQQFANLRLLLIHQFTYPGKKLLFMGVELAQWEEWNHAQSLEWSYLEHPEHKGVQSLVSQLNAVYQKYPALYQYDFEPQGFEWIECDDAGQSVLVFQRRDDHGFLLIILNLTPVVRENYTIGVPSEGEYSVLFNSDDAEFGGSDYLQKTQFISQETPWMNQQQSLVINLPPLAGLILEIKAK